MTWIRTKRFGLVLSLLTLLVAGVVTQGCNHELPRIKDPK